MRRTFTVRGTKKDAEREAAIQVSALASGTYVDPSKETVGEFLERWLRDYVEPSLALRTQLRYRDVVRNDLTPNLGNIPIQRLRPTHILAAEQALRATGNRKTGGPLAPATVRKIHNVLHRALSHAVAWQSIPLNPADAVDRPSIPASTPRVLSPDQARTLLAALDGHRFGLPLRTALLCGLRLSELLALRWADIDWNGGRMLVLQSLELASRRRDPVQSHEDTPIGATRLCPAAAARSTARASRGSGQVSAHGGRAVARLRSRVR